MSNELWTTYPWSETNDPDRTTGMSPGWHQEHAGYAEHLTPPDLTWNPDDELADLLQEAGEEFGTKLPHPRDEGSVTTPQPGSPLGNLHDLGTTLPPLRTRGHGHRKPPILRRLPALRTASYIIAALTAAVTSMVSVFSGMATYGPLLATSAHSQDGPDVWWPMLVYGPWMAASLSVLRAALHKRRAAHSWLVVLLFSSAAVLLCVLQAPRTVTDAVVAALPAVASLTCFHQLVRQITLTRPLRARSIHRRRRG
ncbi:hypothetical protein [Streptomyces sp. NPDC002851]